MQSECRDSGDVGGSQKWRNGEGCLGRIECWVERARDGERLRMGCMRCSMRTSFECLIGDNCLEGR